MCSLPVERWPQITRLHPVLSCAVTSIFHQLYLKHVLSIDIKCDCVWNFSHSDSSLLYKSSRNTLLSELHSIRITKRVWYIRVTVNLWIQVLGLGNPNLNPNPILHKFTGISRNHWFHRFTVTYTPCPEKKESTVFYV